MLMTGLPMRGSMCSQSNRIALRMDDVGASSKYFQVYGKNYMRVGTKKIAIPSQITNFLWLKKCPLWKGPAPYSELSADAWRDVCDLLRSRHAKMTVAVTAGWVEADSSIIPFPEKYPEQARILRDAVNEGLIRIANHGLTHCVVGRHVPLLFHSNRVYHREFWEWVPRETQRDHLARSQEILEEYFQQRIRVLVPAGNVFSAATIDACSEYGIDIINCNTGESQCDGVRVLLNDDVKAFHDWDVVQGGIAWLAQLLQECDGMEKVFVDELVEC